MTARAKRPGAGFPERVIKGVAYDTPVLGYQVNTCNMLRLWKAEAVESFDFQAFNKGDYYEAVEAKLVSENLTKVLYPNDEGLEGKKLRLEQQYFFCSCALRDMIRIHLLKHQNLDEFGQLWTVQLNDTHPAISIAELMRLLVDDTPGALGSGLEYYPAGFLLHQSHPAAGSPGEMVPVALCQDPAPASGDHL